MKDCLLAAYTTKQTPSLRNASAEIFPLNFTISTQPHSHVEAFGLHHLQDNLQPQVGEIHLVPNAKHWQLPAVILYS